MLCCSDVSVDDSLVRKIFEAYEAVTIAGCLNPPILRNRMQKNNHVEFNKRLHNVHSETITVAAAFYF